MHSLHLWVAKQKICSQVCMVPALVLETMTQGSVVKVFTRHKFIKTVRKDTHCGMTRLSEKEGMKERVREQDIWSHINCLFCSMVFEQLINQFVSHLFLYDIFYNITFYFLCLFIWGEVSVGISKQIPIFQRMNYMSLNQAPSSQSLSLIVGSHFAFYFLIFLSLYFPPVRLVIGQKSHFFLTVNFS